MKKSVLVIGNVVLWLFYSFFLIGQPKNATFEEIILKPESFWNGADGSGCFVSGDVQFKNVYNKDWGSWSGFSCSNTTDTKTAGFANQYSAFAGSGYHSKNYAICWDISEFQIKKPEKGLIVKGMWITNSTYTALAMLNGDAFSKKFGGSTGNEPDWLKITVEGILNDSIISGKVELYLADYRNTDNSKDYVIREWTWLDMSKLGRVQKVRCSLSSSDMGSWGMNTPAYFCIDDVMLEEPNYVGRNDKPIHKDSAVFTGWATSCNVKRGYINIMDTLAKDNNSNRASYGKPENAIGKPDNQVISLGDAGSATLTFGKPFKNQAGYDFAVFENSFDGKFLELAFVEVSSDGIQYARFPAVSSTQIFTQLDNSAIIEPLELHNMAGKYPVFYGTPFDLEELKDSPGIDINKISYIRIIDAVGSLKSGFCTFDSKLNKVNDPYPTPFQTGGFDLDAVGILSPLMTEVESDIVGLQVSVFPNPCKDKLIIETNAPFEKYEIFSISGSKLSESNFQKLRQEISLTNFKDQFFILKIYSKDGCMVKKIIRTE
jgi:hypothetical protein